MKHTPRHTATQALLQMEENEGYSNIVIDKALRAAGWMPGTRGWPPPSFTGCWSAALPLEHFLRGCLANPQKKLDPQVWALLLCAAYQILYLDRVPDSAAVNEAVEEAKGIKGGAFAGLVNGVLRSLARKKADLSLPQGDSLQALSLRYSIPQELIALWQRSYGKELTAQLLESFQRRAPLYLRINPLRATAEGPGRLFGTAGLFPEAGGIPALGGGGRGGGLSRQLGGVPGGPVPCAGPLRPAGLLVAGGPARAGCLRLLRCPWREELHPGRGHGEHRQPARL